MKEYRIVKKSMLDVIGRACFKSQGEVFFDVYCVQKKNWFGRWKDVKRATTCVTLAQAEELLDLHKQGKLDKKGYEVVG